MYASIGASLARVFRPPVYDEGCWWDDNEPPVLGPMKVTWITTEEARRRWPVTRSETPAWRAAVPTSTGALTLDIFKRQAERFGIADPQGYFLARTGPPRHWFEPTLSELEKGDRG